MACLFDRLYAFRMSRIFSTRDVLALISEQGKDFTVGISDPVFEDDGRETSVVTLYSADSEPQPFAVTVMRIGRALHKAHHSKENKDNGKPDSNGSNQ